MSTQEPIVARLGEWPLVPPGPRGLPRFGCLNGLLRDPMKFWSRIADTYGGIARVPLKGRHVYLVSDPELLYELLVTNRRNYCKNTRYKAAVDTFGEGLLLAEADYWKRQRLITQPAFKPDYVREQVPAMARLTADFLDRWAIAPGEEIQRDVDEDFLRLSQRHAGHYLMGLDFAAIDERFYAAATGIKTNWPLPPRSLLALFRPRPKGREARLDAAIADIDELVFSYLKTHRRDDFADCGLLSLLVSSSRAQGEEFGDQALRDQLLTLFFAGHETSATSLSWIHYLLWKHPEVRERLKQEIDRVVGTELPNADHLAQLEYTEQVIHETLRLYSPIHSISRVALEDDVLGGYPIAKGAMIYVSLYATHRRAAEWPDPDRFDPDRFTPERTAARPRFSFIPFAAGHRNCIGASMAMVELKLAVAQIAQRFTLNLVPGHRVEKAAGTTMHPRYGMKMSIRNS
jgi:cytochrome P450